MDLQLILDSVKETSDLSQKYFLVLLIIIYSKSLFLKIKVITTVTKIEIIITP